MQGDPLRWLLEPDPSNPAILAAQHPEGDWVKAGSGSSPKSQASGYRLANFEGMVLVVPHDRYFLDQVVKPDSGVG